MKGTTAKFGARLVMKFNPSSVLIEASPLPLNRVVRRSDSSNESRKKVSGVVEIVENRP